MLSLGRGLTCSSPLANREQLGVQMAATSCLDGPAGWHVLSLKRGEAPDGRGSPDIWVFTNV